MADYRAAPGRPAKLLRRKHGWLVLVNGRQHGFSLLGAVVGLGIVMVSLWAFLQAKSAFHVQDVRLNRRIQGQALLASIAVDLELAPFINVEAICSSFGALEATAPSRCLPNGDIQQAPEFRAASPVRLGYRVDLQKGNSRAGTSCVDLVTCRWRAKRHVFEVVLNGVWLTPPSAKVMNRELILRKTR